MRIALIGNMNNMLFQLQRYFDDWEHDATLFLFEEYSHFLPEADVFFDPYKKFKIVKLNWNMWSFYCLKKEEIQKTFEGFDFLIGTDIAPALLYKAGLKLDIFCLHGSDVFQYPFFTLQNPPPNLWQISRYHFSASQFEGIKLANYLALNKSSEIYEIPISLIRKHDRRIASGPFVYLPQFKDEYFEKSSLKNQLQTLKSKFGFLIMHHCSHNWHISKSANPTHTKGNDVLIKAFALYINKSIAEKKGCLILLDYGSDVDKSKDLIKELGITENIFWFPTQNRKDLICAVKMCDIGVGELGLVGWLLYSVIVEFIIMSKPVIHFRNSALYKDQYNGLYEMIDTNDQEVVASTFLDYEINPRKYKNMGQLANKWYIENIQNVSLNSFKEKLIENKNFQNKISFKECFFHSNKLKLAKVLYWRFYNMIAIKLKLNNSNSSISNT